MAPRTPPSWGDHPLPDPVPDAWGTVVALIRDELRQYGGGDRYRLSQWSWALTLLSLRPEGEWAFPRHSADVVRPVVAFAAPPEFVPFVELDGHRTGYVGYGRSTAGYLGWLVPAPELGLADHPVGLVDLDRPATVSGMGHHTRAGLARYFSLLSFLDMPEWYGMDSATGDYANWMRKVGVDIDKVWTALDLKAPPMPDLTRLDAPRPTWGGLRPQFTVPQGWRHEHGKDGVGVLAPDDAFGAEAPGTFRWSQPIPVDQVLTDAEHLLGQGAPASALLLVKNAFAHNVTYLGSREGKGQRLDLGALKPVWARAYTDLGRPQLADRLEILMSHDHPGRYLS
jgi:hypothetical protein